MLDTEALRAALRGNTEPTGEARGGHGEAESGHDFRTPGLPSVWLARTVLHYESKANPVDAELKQRLIELAHERRRFGYRRLYALIRREGAIVNPKRVWRPHRQAGLAVRRRRRRRGVAIDREPLVTPSAPNQVWSMDFVMDALANGRLT